jgi:hypothetical protein
MCTFAAGLASLGVKAGCTVAQFSESSSRWLVADQGVMLNGAANAVRGATTNTKELAYIMKQSQCMGLILQDDAVLSKLVPDLLHSGRLVRFVVVLWGDVSVSVKQQAGVPVLTHNEVRLCLCPCSGCLSFAHCAECHIAPSSGSCAATAQIHCMFHSLHDLKFSGNSHAWYHVSAIISLLCARACCLLVALLLSTASQLHLWSRHKLDMLLLFKL